MQNVISFQTMVTKSSSVKLREPLPMLEPVIRCTSYVLGYVKSQQLKNRLKTNFKDAALFANDGVDIIMLCRGETITGRPYYAFLKVKPSRFSAFEQAQAAGDAFSLQEYGDILQFDYSITPPEDVINQMRIRYSSSL